MQGKLRIGADIEDGGMMLIRALCPHVDWMDGNADLFLQVWSLHLNDAYGVSFFMVTLCF